MRCARQHQKQEGYWGRLKGLSSKRTLRMETDGVKVSSYPWLYTVFTAAISDRRVLMSNLQVICYYYQHICVVMKEAMEMYSCPVRDMSKNTIFCMFSWLKFTTPLHSPMRQQNQANLVGVEQDGEERSHQEGCLVMRKCQKNLMVLLHPPKGLQLHQPTSCTNSLLCPGVTPWDLVRNAIILVLISGWVG